MFARLARLFRRTPAELAWITSDELRQRLDGGAAPMIVDVRGPDEFNGPLGHIPGALNIPLGELPTHTARLAGARQPIVLVCLTDKRSSQAAADLLATGLLNIAVLRGGMKAWRVAIG